MSAISTSSARGAFDLLIMSAILIAASPEAGRAATLSMQFAGGGNEITLTPSDSATVEIYITMGTSDGPKVPSKLTGIEMRFDVGSMVPGESSSGGAPVPGWTPFYVKNTGVPRGLVVTEVSTPIESWQITDSVFAGEFNRNGFLLSAKDPTGVAGPSGTSAGSTLIATFTVHAGPFLPGDTYFAWRQEDPLPALYNGSTAWWNRFGYTSEAGRNTFLHGQGSPGDSDPRFSYHGYEALEPLVIHFIHPACVGDGECDDGVFCNGTDFNSNGQCEHCGDPCSGVGLTCDEVNNECDCNGNEDCQDGLFCNGSEVCVGGECTPAAGSACAAAETCAELDDVCHPDCNLNGVPDQEEIAGGTSPDCNLNAIPDECDGLGTPTASGIIGAVSRKNHGGLGPRGISINVTGRVQDQNLTSEPRGGGIAELRVFFHIPPGGPGLCPVTIFEQSCPGGTPESYQPYSGGAHIGASVENSELVITFSPGLENGRTYKFVISPEVTTLSGQWIEVRCLRGDVNDDGFVNASDRSTIIGVWTGAGFTNKTDLNLSGQTNAVDRAIVVGAWTGPETCAP